MADTLDLFVREEPTRLGGFRIAHHMGGATSASVGMVYGSNVGMSPGTARSLAYLFVASPKLLASVVKLLIVAKAYSDIIHTYVPEADTRETEVTIGEAQAAIAKAEEAWCERKA